MLPEIKIVRFFIALSRILLSLYYLVQCKVSREIKGMPIPVDARYLPSGGSEEDAMGDCTGKKFARSHGPKV